ncbi:MAG TPA: MaoC/PaaZ C-terminal domain-containing protein [Aliidongia sp.]|nr:MaoC/PaaZ C-terminal domain-containing protein [Aliidongia sp.]
MTVLLTRRFLAADQELFARLSGDRNPMHMDPIAARRTQAGAQVVHGIHTVLSCLEGLARSGDRPERPTSIEARFAKPVLVGDSVTIHLAGRTAEHVRLRVELAGSVLATLRLSLNKPGVDLPVIDASPEPGDLPAPRELSFASMPGRSGAVPLGAPLDAFEGAFPAASAWLGAAYLRELAGLSYLVGMECPGLHSIFSSLSVRYLPAREAKAISYSVVWADERVNMVRLAVSGAGLAGEIEAFVRLPPTAQPAIAEIARQVAPDEFAGDVALVVGASRGLGEIAAKIIAAGGGHPIITYAQGGADADAVARDITGFGRPCTVLRYDARLAPEPQLRDLALVPTSLYYFATGQIFRRKSGIFEPQIFRDFLALYVDGFQALCQALAARSPQPLSVFYPSSVAVEDRPEGMAEYAMAKAAGEILCADLARFSPGLDIHVRRLPRTRTDQTATVVPVGAAEPAALMLPIVREVQAAIRRLA